MGTTKTASARALIDPQIKKEAEAILKELGLSVSKSFELYYRQIIAQRGLPFELQIPNEKTMKAIENSRQGKGKTFSKPCDQSGVIRSSKEMSSDSKSGTRILRSLKLLYNYWSREKDYRRKPGITD